MRRGQRVAPRATPPPAPPVSTPLADLSARPLPDVDRLTIALDLETASAEQLFTGKHEGDFVRLMSFGNVGIGYHVTSDHAEMRRIAHDAGELLTHNGWAFDLVALARHLDLPYPELLRKTRDTLVEAKLDLPPADEHVEKYGLDDLGAKYLDERKTQPLKLLAKEFHGYDKIPTTDARYRAYAERDALLTDRLAHIVVPPDASYAARERRIAGIAGLLSLAGLAVDVELLSTRRRDEGIRLDKIRLELVAHGFPEFLPLPPTKRPRKVEPVRKPATKPWSTKEGAQRLQELSEEFGATDWPRTAGGSLSSQADDLRAVAEAHPGTELADVCALIIDAGSTSIPAQLESTMVGGRVHPLYSISTATGRWSSSSPNVLGVGKRTAALLADRDLFVAEPGNVFASIDLSGIDARCVAGLSGDVAYAELFEPGRDIHTEMAEQWFGNGDKASRTAAKAITHGIAYGRGPKAIALQTGRPLEEVAELHADYFRRFPGIAEWHKRIRRAGERGELLPTGSGRFVRVETDRAYTEAPARLAQSAARDLAMDGLLNVLDAGLIETVALFVHDENVVQAPPDEIEELAEDVAALMSFDWTSPSGLVIPVIAEINPGRGPRWSDAYRDERLPPR